MRPHSQLSPGETDSLSSQWIYARYTQLNEKPVAPKKKKYSIITSFDSSRTKLVNPASLILRVGHTLASGQKEKVSFFPLCT